MSGLRGLQVVPRPREGAPAAPEKELTDGSNQPTPAWVTDELESAAAEPVVENAPGRRAAVARTSEILLRGEKHDHVRYTPHPDRNAERSLLDVECGRNSFEKE
jgi:hypothetical protein